MSIGVWNEHVVAMSHSWPSLGEIAGMLYNSFMTTGGAIHDKGTRARCQTAWHHAPFDNLRPLEQEDGCVAKWAYVVRSPLLAKCGVRLAVQRVEKPRDPLFDAANRFAMQNTLSTMIMLDTESGFAPNEWQSGIGDVYLYRGPHYEEDTGDLQHFDTIEAAFIWDYTQGSLGGGEFVGGANEEKYKSGLARYRAQEEEYERAKV